MAKNNSAIAIALVLIFAVSLVTLPLASAQTWSIYISATAGTGLVRIEVRLGNSRQQVPFTGVSLGYLAPGGSWQNVTGLTTTNGRIDYSFGQVLLTNGVWHFQANVPAQDPLPANPATLDGSWYSEDLTLEVQWEEVTFPTVCLVNVAPNPVGVGQTAFVNIFMSVPIVGATMSIGGTQGNHYKDLYIDITSPTGAKTTYGPFVSDPTGGFWMSYTPQTAGNYTAQGRYLGQNTDESTGMRLTTAAAYGASTAVSGLLLTYAPDESPILTFTVQDEPVLGWIQPPLPTEYWSRPIYATNWDWGSQEGSNWWGLNAPSFTNTGGYDASGNVQPYGKAPNSAHIMWTKSTTFGGQPGGSIPSDQEGQYTSTSILNRHWEPIILYGIVYYQTWNTAGESGSTSADLGKLRWMAVDIRTGETVWNTQRGITGSETLRCGWIQKFHSVQEYGSWAALLATGSGGMGYLYDPWTGQHISNVTDVSMGSGIIDTHPDDYRQAGGILRYYTTGGLLTCWNSTRLWGSGPGSGQTNWQNGYEWQVNATEAYPAGTPTGMRVTGLDTLLLYSIPNYLGGFSYQIQGTMTCAGVDARTGKLLWGPIEHTLPQYHDIAMYGSRDGAFVLIDKDQQDIYCYSLDDGHKLWGPVSLVPYTNPWSYIELDAEVVGDKVIFWDFGGNVIGLDKESGEILWHYTRGPSTYDTPYGIYPLWDFGSESFADGKGYFSEGSMYDVPLHPARRLCINLTDGSLVWSILSYSGRAPGVIADGYLLEWNSLSNEIVSFGKGPTATSVAAGPKVSVYGSSVVVEGMVTDISPGTAAYNREARFPHGVPAVSEASQREWMEYVYMQQARPADATGVEVVISVMDSNGNNYEVGRATSDANGMYQLAFDPPITGEYTVYAAFAGSESYWGSHAQTGLFVEEAPMASATPPPLTLPPTETYVAVGTGLIILAIAIVGLLLLRKH